jgi:hypothetical protein
MDDIWKKAAKKLRVREHRAATCAATTFGVETDTPTAKNDNPTVADIENTDTVQLTTPTASNEIEAEVHAIERDWHALGRGPLPEEYRVRIDQIRAREAAKLMKVEGDEKEVVRERAGTEEISDEERERRRKRNEKKRKRKMEKESTKEEKVEEVRTVPDDSSDDALSRTPTNTPLPPSRSTKPPPASPNDRVAPTKPAPTSPKPTVMLSTTDVAHITAQTVANEGIRGVRKLDTKEIRTATHVAGDNATCLAPSSFDWAEDIDTTVTPTPIALVARAPRDFSVLRSRNRNPWGSLSRRHRRSQPCTQRSFYSCIYNTDYPHKPTAPSPLTPPLPPAPVQLVETIRHPHGIAPMKPVIKTTASPTSIPPVHPSMSTSSCKPISTVHPDSPSRSSCAFLLDWSGDPLLVGLARILEVLGWTRDHSAARTPLCSWGAHGVVVDCWRSRDVSHATA